MRSSDEKTFKFKTRFRCQEVKIGARLFCSELIKIRLENSEVRHVLFSSCPQKMFDNLTDKVCINNVMLIITKTTIQTITRANRAI